MLDWLLKYPGADYARGKLSFLGGWAGLGRAGSLALLALLLVVGIALICLTAARSRALRPGQRAVLATLQIAMLGLVALALSQPALLLSTLAARQNLIAVLLDNSASMLLPQAPDGPVAGSRLDQARSVLASGALSTLARRYPLRQYVFAGGVQSVDGYQSLPPAGDSTDIGASVLQVLQALHTSALGAVVLISDGADSHGALSQDELAQIASYGVPVHTIGVGPSRIPEDLELADVSLPARVLPGANVVARVSVRHDGPGSTRLKVYDGDRFLGSRDIQLDDSDGTMSVPISFALDQPGERELSFSLSPKSEEHELRNNAQQRMVQVLQQPASVLYVEGEPRWEYKFMRRALEDDTGVRLVSLLRTTTNGYYRQGVSGPAELREGFPTDPAALDAYSALIIGSLPAATLTSAQLQMIHDFVSERGGSLLMLAGPAGLGDGGWAEGVVGQMLPARLPHAAADAAPVSAGASGAGAAVDDPDESFHRTRVPVVLTPAGKLSAMLQLADDPQRNQQQWDSLPPVQDYQDVGPPRLAATTWLNAQVGQRQQPLLLGQPYGRGQTYILATGGTWRWRMGLPSDDTRFQQFWRQLAHTMVAGVPQPFELEARAGADGIQVRAQLQDAAFRPVDDAQVSVQASSPSENARLTLHAISGQPGFYEGSWRPTGGGPVVLEATARRANEDLGSARTSLEYARGQAEYFSIRQNRTLLQQLASATGGSYWEPTRLDALPQAIRASSAGVPEQQLLPLWNVPLLFLLLAGLKSAEWLLRRRWGRI